jgi:V-type H+-transporting ATPase subunit d
MSNFSIFNRDDGFLEGFVRGLRSTFLTDMEYVNLKEGGQRGGGDGTREDFEDMRLTLQETDYGNFLSAESALDPKSIAARATGKWVREFKYIRASATGTLARFLDFVSAEYMIDNILDLIKAATSTTGAPVDIEAVLENCHPLGLLDASVMKSILAFEDLGEDFFALYRTILVDTPVGKYFTQFLTSMLDETGAADADAVRAAFAEIPMTLIENAIKKLYLEDFHHFCANILKGETGVVMGELLATRADILTINITYNR